MTRISVIIASLMVMSLIVMPVSLSIFMGKDEKLSLNAHILLEQDQSSGLSFFINSYSHAQDLSKIDFAKYSYLQFDNGPRIKAHSWLLVRNGHHLQGKLYFPPFSMSQTKEITLLIDLAVSDSEKGFVKQFDISP